MSTLPQLVLEHEQWIEAINQDKSFANKKKCCLKRFRSFAVWKELFRNSLVLLWQIGHWFFRWWMAGLVKRSIKILFCCSTAKKMFCHKLRTCQQSSFAIQKQMSEFSGNFPPWVISLDSFLSLNAVWITCLLSLGDYDIVSGAKGKVTHANEGYLEDHPNCPQGYVLRGRSSVWKWITVPVSRPPFSRELGRLCQENWPRSITVMCTLACLLPPHPELSGCITTL